MRAASSMGSAEGHLPQPTYGPAAAGTEGRGRREDPGRGRVTQEAAHAQASRPRPRLRLLLPPGSGFSTDPRSAELGALSASERGQVSRCR